MTWNDAIRDPGRRVVRQFAALCAVAFVGIAFWQWLGRDRSELAIVLSVAGVVSGLAGWLAPQGFRWVYTGAMVVVFPVGFLVSQIVLLLVFYGVFLPVGLVLRARGWDPLRRRAREGSGWETRKKTGDRRRYFRQY
jgi:hypothetical protein